MITGWPFVADAFDHERAATAEQQARSRGLKTGIAVQSATQAVDQTAPPIPVDLGPPRRLIQGALLARLHRTMSRGVDQIVRSGSNRSPPMHEHRHDRSPVINGEPSGLRFSCTFALARRPAH